MIDNSSPSHPRRSCCAVVAGPPCSKMGRVALWGILVASLSVGVGHAQTITISGGPGEASDGVPGEYVVQDNDTLWGICETFFGEPWRWPTVWALNPHVTNPHWIYPGDVLRLKTGRARSLPDSIATAPISFTVGTHASSQVSLNEGFLVEEPLERLGTLTWSSRSMNFLAQGDSVYVEFDDLDKVRIGQRYSIYRVLNDVYHPTTEAYLGQKIHMQGILEINRVDVNMATGHIVTSFHEIERGAAVTALLDHYQVVSPRENLIDLEGTIVDVLRRLNEIGQFHLVYIDKGSKDGVLAGNRFLVLRRGDGFLELAPEETKRFPWEQIGELLVVETRDRNSTAIVTRSTLELHVGDRIAMRRHY